MNSGALVWFSKALSMVLTLYVCVPWVLFIHCQVCGFLRVYTAGCDSGTWQHFLALISTFLHLVMACCSKISACTHSMKSVSQSIIQSIKHTNNATSCYFDISQFTTMMAWDHDPECFVIFWPRLIPWLTLIPVCVSYHFNLIDEPVMHFHSAVQTMTGNSPVINCSNVCACTLHLLELIFSGTSRVDSYEVNCSPGN